MGRGRKARQKRRSRASQSATANVKAQQVVNQGGQQAPSTTARGRGGFGGIARDLIGSSAPNIMSRGRGQNQGGGGGGAKGAVQAASQMGRGRMGRGGRRGQMGIAAQGGGREMGGGFRNKAFGMGREQKGYGMGQTPDFMSGRRQRGLGMGSQGRGLGMGGQRQNIMQSKSFGRPSQNPMWDGYQRGGGRGVAGPQRHSGEVVMNSSPQQGGRQNPYAGLKEQAARMTPRQKQEMVQSGSGPMAPVTSSGGGGGWNNIRGQRGGGRGFGMGRGGRGGSSFNPATGRMEYASQPNNFSRSSQRPVIRTAVAKKMGTAQGAFRLPPNTIKK